MPLTPSFPHLSKRRRIWFARLTVPADVRQVIGRNLFIASTGETEPAAAFAKATPWLAEWRNRIESARLALKDPLRAEIERLTRAYRRYRNRDLDVVGEALVLDVIDFIFERQGGLTPDQRRTALANAHGDIAKAIAALPEPLEAGATLDRITGTATPFLTHLEAWQAATHIKGKTLDQYLSDIRKFEKAVDQPMEKLTGRHVQKWIEDGLRSLSADTVRRKLTGLRTYWEWMQAHELVPEDQKPFSDRRVNERRSATEQAEAERNRFEQTDVVRLWQTAESKGDFMLASLIRIGAYSGARREGICQLRIADIKRDPDTEIQFLHLREKTKAGVRDVPIHPAIADLIAELSKTADESGYLIHSTKNKNGRGDAVGKRFSRLKTAMGFGEQFVFHSIRHTVAHLLETAECPPNVAKDIVGHTKSDMTYGVYSGLTRLDHRKRWLEQAIRYSETDSPKSA